MGFRPVTLSQVVANRMNLAPGASPVAITFDDSDRSQINYLSDGTLNPDSAVGIWQSFANAHPDFPVQATFFILPNGPFGDRLRGPAIVQTLLKMGCEIGSHTMTHRSLRKLSDAEVQREFGESVAMIRKLGAEPKCLALPYGISPTNALLIRSYIWAGKREGFRAAVLVGAGPAASPKSANIDPLRLPRIQGIEGPYGLTYWLDKIEAGKVAPYVAGP